MFGSVLTKRVLTPQCDKGRPPLIRRAALPTFPVITVFIIKPFSHDDYDDDRDDDGAGNDNDGKSRL